MPPPAVDRGSRRTTPVDVANGYLEAARSGAALAPFACRPGDRPHPEVPRSQGQYLSSVEIDGS